MTFTVNQEKSTAELAYELATGISGLGSDDIANESGASGATVSDALDSVKSIADSKITTGASVGGDLSGTIASATVAKIQGRAMASTAPTTDQCIQWDGSTWNPATVTSTQVTNSSDVSGTGVTGALNTLLGYAKGAFGVDSGGTLGDATRTFGAADAGKMLIFSRGTGQTLTVPTNATTAFPTGTIITCFQAGAGQLTIAGAGGVTVRATDTLKSREQYAIVALIKIGTDEWYLTGETAAS